MSTQKASMMSSETSVSVPSRSSAYPTWKRALDRAEKLISEGNYRQAISSLERAIHSGADTYHCTLRIAEIYRQLRCHTAARAAAEQAIALAPSRIPAYEVLMEVAQEAGDRESTMSACQSLIKLAPRHIPAYNALGAAYVQIGDVEAAMRVARTLIRLEPESAAHHFKMALLCQHQGEVALAVHEFMQTIRLAPNDDHAEAARDALETLDIFQINQIITLAIEDRVFRTKLARTPVDAAIERGFALSEAGDQLLTEFCADSLTELPETIRPMVYN